MATRPRDSLSSLNSLSLTSKNKENIPHAPSSSSANRAARSFIPSLVKSPEKQQEFFTDSFLGNNASQTSLIPSPLPSTKPPLSKPRKTVRTHTRPKQRPIQPDSPVANSVAAARSHPKSSTRGSSPVHSTGLTTPPRSRDGSYVGSPVDVPSSPPPALTATYHRIDQEEDLAATEGEISDPESEQSDKENIPQPNGYLPLKVPSVESLRRLQRSRAATPTNEQPFGPPHRSRHNDLTTQSVFSDPTGMSFVDQISDPNLRSTLTPHFQQSAQDREALEKVWRSKKPIAFSRAGQVLLDADNIAESVSSSPRVQPDRVVAFSKAARIKLSSDHLLRPHHQRTFSDVTEQIDRTANQPQRTNHNDNWHNDDLRREAMPHNPRVHRQPYFARNHGFPERRVTSHQESAESRGANGVYRKARSESPFVHHSSQLDPPLFERDRMSKHNQLDGNTTRKSDGDLTRDNQTLTETSIDIWAQEAADRPMRSIEHDTHPRSRSRLSDPHDVDTSPEKSRRFDIDFTGQSFQVSESPPVRSKNMPSDIHREREIRGLERRAVTTSRLTQIRARESQERLRQASRSPVSEPDDRFATSNHINGDSAPIASTPIYRTTSNSSTGRRLSATTAKPALDRSSSHDILQRLARGSSSTPRSSTPSDKNSGGILYSGNGEQKEEVASANDDDDQTTPVVRADQFHPKPDSGSTLVEATPKVTGAWTDTILPDTIKTARKATQNTRYAQTPYVSAGGWVDTPAPNGQPKRLDPVLEATQEVPAELMEGIVKDSAGEETILPDTKTGKISNNNLNQPIGDPPESLAQKVLNEAKEKLEAQALSRQNDMNDSFVLGNDTIQSLENILDTDVTDLTIASRLGNESDTQVLDRLGTKLDRLRHNIHDARKGLSKLEHQMSHPEDVSQTSNVATTTGQKESASTSFPSGLLTLSVPIPILFRHRKGHHRLPQPTALGWLVLSVWCWYLIECTLGEIYSHPQYAERYTWPTRPEPEFPLVLPTMLWRWSRMDSVEVWLIEPIRTVITGFLRLIGIWLGWTDGFTEGPADAAAHIVTGAQIPEQMGGFDMINDEFL